MTDIRPGRRRGFFRSVLDLFFYYVILGPSVSLAREAVLKMFGMDFDLQRFAIGTMVTNCLLAVFHIVYTRR